MSLEKLLFKLKLELADYDEEKLIIVADLLWKVVRQDWHGVSDAANDLRELHL